jgi:hypothetical protein
MKKYFLMTSYGETCGDFFEVREDEDVKEKAVDEYYKWVNNPKYFDRSQEIPKEALYKMFEDDSEEDEGGETISIVEVVNKDFYNSEEWEKMKNENN